MDGQNCAISIRKGPFMNTQEDRVSKFDLIFTYFLSEVCN